MLAPRWKPTPRTVAVVVPIVVAVVSVIGSVIVVSLV
jgi:hypothetical protein